MKFNNLLGKEFGRLKVIRQSEPQKNNIYWECQCSCGKITNCCSSNLMTGKSKSCGCLRKEITSERAKQMERKTFLPGVGSCNFLWNRYHQGAKKRNLSFELSKEFFLKITSENCHYCGTEPRLKIKGKRSNGEYIYNGVDRIDSDEGYNINNVVPCCSVCNYAKNDMKYDDYIIWINQLVKFRCK